MAGKGKLALHGTSAGGLLATNLFLSDPELFGALVLRMPFLDLFTAMMDPNAVLTQHEWDEWGDPRQPGGVKLLQELCPYQVSPCLLPILPCSKCRCLLNWWITKEGGETNKHPKAKLGC